MPVRSASCISIICCARASPSLTARKSSTSMVCGTCGVRPWERDRLPACRKRVGYAQISSRSAISKLFRTKIDVKHGKIRLGIVIAASARHPLVALRRRACATCPRCRAMMIASTTGYPSVQPAFCAGVDAASRFNRHPSRSTYLAGTLKCALPAAHIRPRHLLEIVMIIC